MPIDPNNVDTEAALPAPGLTQARERFAWNVLSNAAYIGAQAFVTLWMTSYLIGYLGLAAYAMIPLTQNIVAYTSILTSALNTAVTRFLTIELEQNQMVRANKTFNTALFSVIGLFFLLTPAILVIALAFPQIFNIPAGWEQDASWLFIITAVTFFLSVAGGVFSVSTFVYSEFVKFNLVNFVGLISRALSLVLLFSLFSPRIWYAGASAFLAAAVTLLGYLALWRQLTPGLKIASSSFDRTQFKEQFSMGGWMVVNMVGALLLSRADLLVVNAFYGAATTGGYASLVQFTLFMEYLVTAAGNVVRPVILIKYAQEDFAGLRVLCIQAVKLLGFGMALPIGLLCGFSKPFLSLWLGPSFVYLGTLMVVILIHQALNYSVRPMLFVQTAYNKVRWPGIVTLICGIASVVLGIFFAVWDLWGVIGVAFAVGLTWTVKNALYMPLYTAHIMKLKWWTFFPSLAASIFGTLLVVFLTYASTLLVMPDTWIELAVLGGMVSIVYAAVVWFVGLSRNERSLVTGLVGLRRASQAST